MKLSKTTAAQSLAPSHSLYSVEAENYSLHSQNVVDFRNTVGKHQEKIIPMAAAPAFPSLSDALDDANIVHSLKQAWQNTQSQHVEWGGWIYYKPGDNKYAISLKTDNQESSIVLTKVADIQRVIGDRAPKNTIVADFHCHPGGYAGAGRPSDADIAGARDIAYTRLVFTPDANIKFPDEIYRNATPRPTPDNFPDGAIMWQIN